MSADELRALQTPLKARYREDPASAVVTLKARGRLGLERWSGTKRSALSLVPSSTFTIHDLELLPGTTVAWYFHPMTNGQGLPLYCHKEGHREGGMVGAITISGPPPFQPTSSH